MNLEHIALNVPDPKAQAKWYAEHLGMQIVRDLDDDTLMTFIADETGSMIELYRNAKAEVPDYTEMSPYELHLAFSSSDIAADKARLLAAGATDLKMAVTLPTGDAYEFLRDPWGVSVQLIKRSKPLV